MDELNYFNAEKVDFETIFPGDSLIVKLRKCKKNTSPFDFWKYLPDEDKNGEPNTAMLDIQSVGAVLAVYDNLKESNQKKFLDLIKGNPFVAAGFSWELLGKHGK